MTTQLDKWQQEIFQLDKLANLHINSDLYKSYKELLKGIKNSVADYIADYDELSFSKRLEAERQLNVAKDIEQQIVAKYKNINSSVKKFSKESAEMGYNGTWYALEGAENITLDMPMLDDKYLNALINEKVKGSIFSAKLYKYRDKLAKNTTSALLQGLAHGKGYPEIAKQISELTEASYKQALRIAKTEGGRTQSHATQQSYEDAEDLGVKMEKQWMATLDKKTRIAHQALDGQRVGVKENFNFNGNPAQGPRLFHIAGLDINCRCTTIAVVNGVAPELRRDNMTGETAEFKSYNDWAEEKGFKAKKEKVLYKAGDELPAGFAYQGNKLKTPSGKAYAYKTIETFTNGKLDNEVDIFNKFGVTKDELKELNKSLKAQSKPTAAKKVPKKAAEVKAKAEENTSAFINKVKIGRSGENLAPKQKGFTGLYNDNGKRVSGLFDSYGDGEEIYNSITRANSGIFGRNPRTIYNMDIVDQVNVRPKYEVGYRDLNNRGQAFKWKNGAHPLVSEQWNASNISKDEANALYRYTEGSSYINEPMRGESYLGDKDHDWQRDAKLINSAMDKYDLTENISVVRRDSHLANGLLNKGTYRDGGYYSTSVDTSMEWEGVPVIIDVPKGKGRGVYLHAENGNRSDFNGISSINGSDENVNSYYGGEMEFVLSSNAEIRLKSVIVNELNEAIAVHAEAIFP